MRVDHYDARLIHHKHLSCAVGAHLRKELVEARQNDRPRDHADDRAVLLYRNTDDGNRLP